MKNFLYSVFVVVIVFTYTDHVSAQPSYQFVSLGTLGGPASNAYGINSNGQIVGGAMTNGNSNSLRAYIYSNGVMTQLDTTGTTGYSEAYGINDRGDIVGQGNFGGSNRPFLYSNNTMLNMGSLGGNSFTAGVARSINTNGQVAGNAFTSNLQNHAFFYSNFLMYDATPNLPSENTFGYAINDSGMVLGSITNRSIFLSTNGMVGYIGVTGDPGDLNNAGHVVGRTGTSAFLWQNGITQLLGPGMALGVNNHDQVVGTDNSNHGFVYTNGVYQDLNIIVWNIPLNWVITSATAINDSGQIVGKANDLTTGWDHAFLLNPIPSPASLSLLCLGTLLISRRRR